MMIPVVLERMCNMAPFNLFSTSPVVFKNLMPRRPVKSRANRASDEAIPVATQRKQAMASDD
jgi:hypothetical protein